jgi:predicted nucleotidyltransferase
VSTNLFDVDPDTANAARAFLGRVSKRYSVDHAILFGSRARRTHQPQSDADIAVVLNGEHGERAEAAIEMAGIAFDVLLDTGVLIQALPLWQDEFEQPEQFSNPDLIENIRRDGICL